MKRDMVQKKAAYDKIQQRINEVSKQREDLLKAGKVPFAIITQYATESTKPIGDLSKADIFKRYIFLGLLIGLIISLIMASIKDTIVSECDFGLVNMPDLPLVTAVPFIKTKKRPDVGSHLLFAHDDSSEYINAYRSLMTHIKLDALGGSLDKKVMLFTNPGSKVGKSTICANLALVLARLGKKTVLVDANINRTSVAKFFGIRARVLGISDILSGKAQLVDCLKGITDMLLGGVDWDVITKSYGLDRLMILPSGRKVSNPSGLLESEKLPELFDKLREQFDCIIVDSPALLRNPDSIILSSFADALFVVCKTNKTSHRDLLNCSKKLTEVKTKFKGTILICT